MNVNTSSEHLVEERGRARIGVQLVRQLLEAVPLVVVDEQLAADAALGQRAMDLLRLTHGDAGVVGAVDDEERRPDAVDVRQGRRLPEEVAVALERAVLALAELAPPLGGVLEERDEAGDSGELDPRPPAP